MYRPRTISVELSNKFKWLSFVATWAVVTIHSSTGRWVSGLCDWETQFEDSVRALMLFAVPTFFVISGFLFTRSYEEYGWRTLLARRFKSLYVPALLWSIIGWLVCLPIRCYVGNPKPLADVLAIPLLLGTTYESLHFWYVRDLLIFIILSPLMIWAARRWSAFILFVVVAMATQLSATLMFENTHVAIFYFSFGVALSAVGDKCRQGMIALFCIVGAVALLTDLKMLAVFKPSLGIGLIWFLYDALNALGCVSMFPSKFGVLFAVYCMHLSVVDYVGGIMRVLLPSSAAVRLLAFLAISSTFWLSLLFSNLMRWYSPRIYGVLSGGR